MRAGIDTADDSKCLRIDHRDVIVRRAGYEDAQTVGLDLYAGRAFSGADSLYFFVSGRIQNDDIRIVQHRNEHELSIRCELQAICGTNVRRQSSDDLFSSNIDDGNGAVS